ncbi:MAG: hypothetical protein U1E60_18915 [Reyranellaceae bacterium]
MVLERASDPSALLNADWASRQQQLAVLTPETLAATYGADPRKYADALSELAALGIQTVDQISPVNGYVSSAESRTIWVQVNQDNFTTLFGPGAQLLRSGSLKFWNGDLGLPESLASDGVKGVMFDTSMFDSVLANPGGGAVTLLPQGPQSPGNAASQSGLAYPSDLAGIYDYPFNSTSTPAWWTTVQTGAIGLLEPNQGTLVNSSTFQTLADTYRQLVGIDATGSYIDVAPGGASIAVSGERSLDVGIVTTATPTSPVILYAGSGSGSPVDATSNVYTAYQAAFWDVANNPSVVSSSYRSYPHLAPGAPGAESPFYLAVAELFVDAVLRNITVINAVGDGGSGDQFGNGLVNVDVVHASPYTIVAGGTSLSSLATATLDPTLASIAAAATAGDPATIWQLVAGGLTVLPTSASADSPVARLIETVWNQYFVVANRIVDKNDNGGGYNQNFAAAGGVDPSQPQPSYQTDFGLNLATSGPSALAGRGVPDVAALAGGNQRYIVPTADMTGVASGAGTSAAAPMWASLVSQLDAVFNDQGLPNLGYMNDLLYVAAAIAPAAFNDVTLGINTSSFSLGGPYMTPTASAVGLNPLEAVTPTGFGYSAGPGYDLTTGLGTPDGVLLGRALTAIAHQQMSFSSSPSVLDPDGAGGWKSAASQSLLVQTTADALTAVNVVVGPDATALVSLPSEAFAWSSRLAQQSLQPDFDPGLVRLFDMQTQGALASVSATAGESLSVAIDARSTVTPQATLTTPFGFADFVSGAGAVRVARPVAIAETAGGSNDQNAVVRIRQDGQDSLTLKLYRVDDLNGTIDGLHPGDPGYQAAISARAYEMTTGGTSLNGPGYGNYVQTELQHVNARDLIAMQLTDNTHGDTYSGFAQANETVNGQPVGHLWNYGLNTWGWEDTRGGGDRDYNDLIVGIDFTSAFGHGWLV